jgi:hypothetical protein
MPPVDSRRVSDRVQSQIPIPYHVPSQWLCCTRRSSFTGSNARGQKQTSHITTNNPKRSEQSERDTLQQASPSRWFLPSRLWRWHRIASSARERFPLLLLGSGVLCPRYCSMAMLAQTRAASAFGAVAATYISVWLRRDTAWSCRLARPTSAWPRGPRLTRPGTSRRCRRSRSPARGGNEIALRLLLAPHAAAASQRAANPAGGGPENSPSEGTYRDPLNCPVRGVHSIVEFRKCFCSVNDCYGSYVGGSAWGLKHTSQITAIKANGRSNSGSAVSHKRPHTVGPRCFPSEPCIESSLPFGTTWGFRRYVPMTFCHCHLCLSSEILSGRTVGSYAAQGIWPDRLLQRLLNLG